MRTPYKKWFLAVAIALVVGMQAEHGALADSQELDERQAVSDRELDAVRGGYDLGSGLQIPFGFDIKRDTFIDGVQVATSTMNIPLDGVSGQQLPDQLNGKGPIVIQTGVEGSNVISPTVLKNLGPGLFTFIQNTLNNKVIQQTTQINATLSSLSMFRQMNLSSSLNQQLINSIR